MTAGPSGVNETLSERCFRPFASKTRELSGFKKEICRRPWSVECSSALCTRRRSSAHSKGAMAYEFSLQPQLAAKGPQALKVLVSYHLPNFIP